MDDTRLSDETLLLLIAHSQASALSELYDRYGRLVYSVALNTLSDTLRAEEVTQDVFERVGESPHLQRWAGVGGHLALKDQISLTEWLYFPYAQMNASPDLSTCFSLTMGSCSGR
jgi:DNA-directed RNA polymerase specialized sigma24 family protein